MSDDSPRFHRQLAGLATDWVRAKRRNLERGRPSTVTDQGGTIGNYSFEGQELDRSELRKVKQIREKGGLVAWLFEAKSLMKFGTGADLQSENDDLQEWLDDNFGRVDLTTLDLGQDAVFYPYGLGEVVETRGGEFSHIELIEPWTMLPKTSEHGEILAWEQETQDGTTQPFAPEEIGSIVLNKSSGRDKVGVSEVLRSEEEITQYKENQRALNKAIEVSGIPHHVWTVGSEGRSPVDDNDLRRVRNLIDNMDGDTQFVVGPDIDHDKITPSDLDYEGVTRRDLRMLTTTVGLPLEMAGYGREGMGSGSETDLIGDLLALQNEVSRRRFETQFVAEFVEPVVDQYSPYDAESEPIEMHIAPFLDERKDVASLIEKIGDYMTNEEIRDRLDLPPLEDDEIADAYRTPKEIEEAEEAPEDAGGGLGGGDAFFSERRMEVPDNAVAIDSPSEAPEDAQIVEGDQGGLYYVPSGNGGEEEEDGEGGVSVEDEEGVNQAVQGLEEGTLHVPPGEDIFEELDHPSYIVDEDAESPVPELEEGELVVVDDSTNREPSARKIHRVTNVGDETVQFEGLAGRSEGLTKETSVDGTPAEGTVVDFYVTALVDESSLGDLETTPEKRQRIIDGLDSNERIQASQLITQKSSPTDSNLADYHAVLNDLSQEELNTSFEHAAAQSNTASSTEIDDIESFEGGVPGDATDELPEGETTASRLGYLTTRMDEDTLINSVTETYDSLMDRGEEERATRVVESGVYYGRSASGRKELLERYEDEVDFSNDNAIEMQTTEDTDEFKSSLLDGWVESGTSVESHLSILATQGVGPNTTDNSSTYVTDRGIFDDRASAVPMAPIEPTSEMKDNINDLNDRATEYYEENDMPELYRGVNSGVTTHGTVESWTVDRKVAEEFDGHSVLEAEVEPEDVLISEDMVGDEWPSPENVNRSEEEVIVFGGAFDNNGDN